MDFSFTEEEKKLQQEIREFAKKELPPDFSGGLYDYEDQFDEKSWPLTSTIVRKLGEKNWLAPAWPKEYGGEDDPYTKQLVCQEELAYWGIPGADMGVGGISWIGSSLMLFGAEEQKKEHLPKLAAGEKFWCTAYSEPGSGCDLATLQCRATPSGSDYIITGQKVWTSAARIADRCWLAARTSSEGAKHQGISLFIVDMKTPGITVRPIPGMAGIAPFGEIFFDEVRVPRGNLVGEENKGWRYMVVALEYERGFIGLVFAAGARRALDDLIMLIGEMRHQGRTLPNETLMRNRVADMAIEIEVGRMLCYRAAWVQSKGLSANYETAMSKLYATELSQRVAQTSMQVLGLYSQLEAGSKWAYLRGLIARSYLASVGNTILAGTSEIERNVMATWGLKLPR